jgi:hypothetical protein
MYWPGGLYKQDSSNGSTGNSGVGGRASEPVRYLRDMKTESILPVTLDRYEDFQEYARQAALVTYRPYFYRGPFLDDPERLRRVTFTAVGVRVKGVLLNFSYTLSYEDFYNPKVSWSEQAEHIEQKMSDVVDTLRSECGIVRGELSSGNPLGEELTARP